FCRHSLIKQEMAEADDQRVVHLKTTQQLSSAQRQGLQIEANRKFDSGSNKQHKIDKDARKLDQETENLHHNRVGMDVGKLIQQGRQAKGLSQKDLATRINEKPQVIAEYENGQAIPNNQVLGKIERQIGIKLRGKEKGQSLSQPTAAPGPAAATGKGKKK
ncbi:hypothetical protein BOX15_Mlig031903g1, partial [Macrostomum lignano]